MTVTRRGTKTDPNAMEGSNSSSNTPSRAGTRSASASASTSVSARTSPYLPTSLERIFLALFPILLVFGSLYSIINPETRSSPYDPVSQSHHQDPNLSPNYFARKSNIFNVVFVKRGWAWTIAAFVAFVCTHPSFAAQSGGSTRKRGEVEGVPGVMPTPKRLRAGIRSVVVTMWWFLMTQWCFGAPIIDRGFRWTGGRCELVQREIAMGDTSVGEKVTSVACKAAGGKWKGGHDISGHVFLLVLGTAFLMQEVGWPLLRWTGWDREQRCVVMHDGAVKSASVEAETGMGEGEDGPSALGAGGKFAVAIMGLSLWMLLMTAIYFHTWFEKLTGLLAATIGVYVVYIVPRFVPAVRNIVGMPGI